MDALSFTEENYLKAIYALQGIGQSQSASVTEIAERVNTRPATVTDMLKKLSDKHLIHYEKYKKPQLTAKGLKYALQVVRKHRLWEVFLHKELNFSWDEVHEIAEQLEHIQSSKLTQKLDEYLGYPRFDPHGDPIPNEKGEIYPASNITLSMTKADTSWKIVAVKETDSAFLQHMQKIGLQIGTEFTVQEILHYDGSIMIALQTGALLTLSKKIADNLLVVERMHLSNS